jgi:hypothetical protein
MRCNASPAQGLRPGLLSDVPSGLKTSALGRARPVIPCPFQPPRRSSATIFTSQSRFSPPTGCLDPVDLAARGDF